MKRHPSELKECGEQLSKLYVNLLQCDDLVDTQFSEKLLDSGLSAVSKFNVAISEVKTHISKGRLQDAERSSEQLKELASTPTDEVELLLVRATLSTKKGELEQAGRYLEDAIKIAEKGGRDPEARKLKASALKQIGGNLNIRGQYDMSLKRLQESMAIYIEVGDKVGELGALSAIGYVYLDLKEDSRAESAFKQTLDFANANNDREALCNALLDLGNLYINSRETEKACEHVERALAIAQDLRIEYNVARAYAALCNTSSPGRITRSLLSAPTRPRSSSPHPRTPSLPRGCLPTWATFTKSSAPRSKGRAPPWSFTRRTSSLPRRAVTTCCSATR